MKKCPICFCEMEYKEGERVFIDNGVGGEFFECWYCGQCDLIIPDKLVSKE